MNLLDKSDNLRLPRDRKLALAVLAFHESCAPAVDPWDAYIASLPREPTAGLPPPRFWLVPCARCAAQPGEPCVSLDGEPVFAHGERVTATRRSRDLRDE